jgi:anti-anti-sigma regulatory factor
VAFAMSIGRNSPKFEAVTRFEGSEATIVLSGSVESAAPFALSATLDAAIDRHPTSMVLDLAKLDFMSAAGLVAISNAEKRLAALDVILTVKSPLTLVNRVLGLMEQAEALRLERAGPEHAHLGPEELGQPSWSAQRFASSLGTKDLRRVTGMPADPDVIDGALRLVVELALANVAGADGVSVSLMRHGVLSTVAASDQTIMAMDADQYSTGEGPCVDASFKGHWFHAESLDTEIRWPAFTPQARSLGIRAILSSPLRAFGEPVGALNIYSRTAETFEIKDQELAAVFAEKASVILSDARANVSDTQMALRFQEALRNREVISLARGIIMERDGVDAEAAFGALLRSSLSRGLPLHEQAIAVMLSAFRPELASGAGQP